MKPNISVLLPTRGRTDMLQRSVNSLLTKAETPEKIEVLFGFDTDDKESQQYFEDVIAKDIDAIGSTYKMFEFEPMGYVNLHRYVNGLGSQAQADWWVFWNDDANMIDSNWDTVICSQGDRFVIQQFDTHNLHPYSIFPIMPRAWYDLLGWLSRHPLNDAYISQIGWMLDIMHRIDIRVDHDRFDLTGENQDDTFENRNLNQLEGNVDNPSDFNYYKNRGIRNADANRVAVYLSERGHDMSHWNEICRGERDPWEKMFAADVNNQVARVENSYGNSGIGK